MGARVDAQAAEALGRWAARARGARQGARPGRAYAHGGHAGWVRWASVSFGEPDSVFDPILTQYCS